MLVDLLIEKFHDVRFMTMLLGVCGALLATYVGVGLGWYREGTTAGWIAAVLGSLVLLVIYGMVRRKS